MWLDTVDFFRRLSRLRVEVSQRIAGILTKFLCAKNVSNDFISKSHDMIVWRFYNRAPNNEKLNSHESW